MVVCQVSLTPSDPLYEMKAKFLATAERREAEAFPLYADRSDHHHASSSSTLKA